MFVLKWCIPKIWYAPSFLAKHPFYGRLVEENDRYSGTKTKIGRVIFEIGRTLDRPKGLNGPAVHKRKNLPIVPKQKSCPETHEFPDSFSFSP